MSNDSGKPFRFKSEKVHLTYPTHIPHQEWIDWFNSEKAPQVQLYSICHENGKNSDYPHTHILVKFNKPVDTTSQKYFDYPSDKTNKSKKLHPNLQKINNKAHWDTIVYEYHNKEKIGKWSNIPTDTTSDLEEDKVDTIPLSKVKLPPPIFTPKDAMNCSSIREAIEKDNKLKNVGSIERVFKYKLQNYGPEPKIKWREWQSDLLTELQGSPHRRSVLWYCDEKGGSGKSVLGDFMEKFRGAFVSTHCESYHIATTLAEAKMVSNIEYNTVIIDLSRTDNDADDFYTGLEQIKNGKITAKKYKGGNINFQVPHLIVFANRMPRKFYFRNSPEIDDNGNFVGYKKEKMATLSEDRWDIRILKDKKVIKREFNPLPEDEVEEGFVIPGNYKPIAEPDVPGDYDDWDPEELGSSFTSVSSPRRK
jgi:hypothetical protein